MLNKLVHDWNKRELRERRILIGVGMLVVASSTRRGNGLGKDE